MKIGKDSTPLRTGKGPLAKGALRPALDEQIDGLRQAKTLAEIGGLLSGIAGSLSSGQKTDALTPAFTAAMEGRPGGVRSVVTQSDPDQVRLFCGTATPERAKQIARDHGVEPGKSWGAAS